MARDVSSLEVFRRAYDLSLVVHRASLAFPRAEQFGGIADQLRRASKSVCALLVEGGGRQGDRLGGGRHGGDNREGGSQVEFRRYVRMALGSAEEARLWCRYAGDLGYAAPDEVAAWQAAFGDVIRMLQGLLRHLAQSSGPI